MLATRAPFLSVLLLFLFFFSSSAAVLPVLVRASFAGSSPVDLKGPCTDGSNCAGLFRPSLLPPSLCRSNVSSSFSSSPVFTFSTPNPQPVAFDCEFANATEINSALAASRPIMFHVYLSLQGNETIIPYATCTLDWSAASPLQGYVVFIKATTQLFTAPLINSCTALALLSPSTPSPSSMVFSQRVTVDLRDPDPVEDLFLTGVELILILYILPSIGFILFFGCIAWVYHYRRRINMERSSREISPNTFVPPSGGYDMRQINYVSGQHLNITN